MSEEAALEACRGIASGDPSPNCFCTGACGGDPAKCPNLVRRSPRPLAQAVEEYIEVYSLSAERAAALRALADGPLERQDPASAKPLG